MSSPTISSVYDLDDDNNELFKNYNISFNDNISAIICSHTDGSGSHSSGFSHKPQQNDFIQQYPIGTELGPERSPSSTINSQVYNDGGPIIRDTSMTTGHHPPTSCLPTPHPSFERGSGHLYAQETPVTASTQSREMQTQTLSDFLSDDDECDAEVRGGDDSSTNRHNKHPGQRRRSSSGVIPSAAIDILGGPGSEETAATKGRRASHPDDDEELLTERSLDHLFEPAYVWFETLPLVTSPQSSPHEVSRTLCKNVLDIDDDGVLVIAASRDGQPILPMPVDSQDLESYDFCQDPDLDTLPNANVKPPSSSSSSPIPRGTPERKGVRIPFLQNHLARRAAAKATPQPRKGSGQPSEAPPPTQHLTHKDKGKAHSQQRERHQGKHGGDKDKDKDRFPDRIRSTLRKRFSVFGRSPSPKPSYAKTPTPPSQSPHVSSNHRSDSAASSSPTFPGNGDNHDVCVGTDGQSQDGMIQLDQQDHDGIGEDDSGISHISDLTDSSSFSIEPQSPPGDGQSSQFYLASGRNSRPHSLQPALIKARSSSSRTTLTPPPSPNSGSAMNPSSLTEGKEIHDQAVIASTADVDDIGEINPTIKDVIVAPEEFVPPR